MAPSSSEVHNDLLGLLGVGSQVLDLVPVGRLVDHYDLIEESRLLHVK